MAHTLQDKSTNTGNQTRQRMKILPPFLPKMSMIFILGIACNDKVKSLRATRLYLVSVCVFATNEGTIKRLLNK